MCECIQVILYISALGIKIKLSAYVFLSHLCYSFPRVDILSHCVTVLILFLESTVLVTIKVVKMVAVLICIVKRNLNELTGFLLIFAYCHNPVLYI